MSDKKGIGKGMPVPGTKKPHAAGHGKMKNLKTLRRKFGYVKPGN